MGGTKTDLLKKLPRVDDTLAHKDAAPMIEAYGRTRAVAAIRAVIDDLRGRARDGAAKPADLSIPRVLEAVRVRLRRDDRPALCRVVNATGVVLHTGLGRAVLPAAAIEAIVSEQSGYSMLEIDRATGERGTRETHVSALVAELTGAEAATVVNNNAGATMLALHALAAGREVVVSRGQLVEIGGSFRIPDVMAQSGAVLVEVGTTNKTHLRDYENAIGDVTGLLLRVHTSNFRIIGFTESPSLEEMIELGRKRGVPVMDDLGSGSLVDLRPFGIAGEPTVQESVQAGADVITFSGDKLLGGPQAGLLVGRRDAIARIRKDPLFRALRPDKLTLTALEATLKLYREPEKLAERHPVIGMLSAKAADLEPAALKLAAALKKIDGLSVEARRDASQVGGGSVPGQLLDTWVVAVRRRDVSAQALSQALRENDPPVFARIQDDRVLLDVRTLRPGDAAAIVDALS